MAATPTSAVQAFDNAGTHFTTDPEAYLGGRKKKKEEKGCCASVPKWAKITLAVFCVLVVCVIIAIVLVMTLREGPYIGKQWFILVTMYYVLVLVLLSIHIFMCRHVGLL